MNRGSVKAAAYATGRLFTDDRFNEAPIHESGKYRLPQLVCPSNSRSSASMRPRFMNRGS